MKDVNDLLKAVAKDGGVAYPVAAGNCVFHNGMSYRQWLAGLAMQIAFDANVPRDTDYEVLLAAISKTAIAMADALIAELERTQ